MRKFPLPRIHGPDHDLCIRSMQECIFERHSKLHKSARNLKRDAHEMFVDKTRIRAIQVRLHRAMHGEASPTI